MYLIVDSPWNREVAPELIGRMVVHPPSYVQVRLLNDVRD